MDTGDLLYSPYALSRPNMKQIGELKAELYMKAYNLMGYDAFTPGELDLSFGVQDVIRMSKQANFPFLAANLVDEKSGRPVFQSYVIKEVQGIKIGVTGLISNRLSLGGPPEEEGQYHLTDPFQTARKVIGEMKERKCQVVFVMAHMEMEEQEKLAREVSGIQFILSGHPNYYPEPMKANHTKIFSAGTRGENLGQVDFTLEQKKLQSRFQLVALTANFADQPQVQEMLNQYKTKLQNLVQSSPQTDLGSPSSRQEISIPVNPLYVGAKTCLPCHPQEYQGWLQSAHSRAYQTLVQKKQASDPTCLACHTTGYGAAKQSETNLENIQCEACHGPGEGHPGLRKNFPPVREDLCRQCHNPANSPNFDYTIYLPKIRHPR